jgi:hypothetical protein
MFKNDTFDLTTRNQFLKEGKNLWWDKLTKKKSSSSYSPLVNGEPE